MNILEGQVSKLLGAMMGVSYRGERMIGNLPYSLFIEQKGRKKKNIQGHKRKRRDE